MEWFKRKYLKIPEKFSIHRNFFILSIISLFYSLYCLLGFNININKAYKYIIKHPLEYMNYIHKNYEKNKEYFQSCINDTNCIMIKDALRSDKKAYYFKKLSEIEKEEFIARKKTSLQQMCIETVDSMTQQELLIDYQVMKKLKEEYSW